MDAGTIRAAAAASSATYRSFADATRSVLDLLERLMPGCAVVGKMPRPSATGPPGGALEVGSFMNTIGHSGTSLPVSRAWAA